MSQKTTLRTRAAAVATALALLAAAARGPARAGRWK